MPPVLRGSRHHTERRVLRDIRPLHHLLPGGQDGQRERQEEEGGGGEDCKAAPRGNLFTFFTRLLIAKQHQEVIYLLFFTRLLIAKQHQEVIYLLFLLAY